MTSIRPFVDSAETYLRLVGELSEKPLTIQEFAENVLELHWGVASSPSKVISGGHVYEQSQANLLAMIRLAYPGIDATEVYEVWVECNESLSYCVRCVQRYADH